MERSTAQTMIKALMNSQPHVVAAQQHETLQKRGKEVRKFETNIQIESLPCIH